MNTRVFGVLTLAGLLAGCSGEGGKGEAQAQNNSKSSSGAAAQQPGGGGRGRGPITIAATDVTAVRTGMIEDAVPVTGNLQPLERVEIRARLEGEILNVAVREGERVRPGQMLARFDSDEEESAHQSAQADVAAAKTEVSTAEWELEQTRELFKEGAVPERDVKSDEQSLASARARLAAAESRLRTSAQALTDTRVVAPTDALVERRLVSNGEHVNRGASLFTLVRTGTLELTGAVPARLANRITTGQVVRFVADARTFTGKVARVSPTIDPASRSVSVYIQVPNSDGSLKGGTFASGRIVSRMQESALIIPTSALRQEQNTGAPYVFRITGDDVERTPVEIGLIDEASGIAQVVNGLKQGDRVISSSAINIAQRQAKVLVIGGETQSGGAQPVPRQ